MSRRAFTLVELLTVIAVISVLVALLLPAVQAAREGARRAECKNHLRQLGLAFLHYEEAIGFFPSSGWGGYWPGVPDRGIGTKQPGGWPYQTLPYIEQQALFDLGHGFSESAFDEAQRTRLSTPLPVHHCPTRRAAAAYPWTLTQLAGLFKNVPRLPTAKNDYAANVGDPIETCCVGQQPISFEQFDTGKYEFPDTSLYTGVIAGCQATFPPGAVNVSEPGLNAARLTGLANSFSSESLLATQSSEKLLNRLFAKKK